MTAISETQKRLDYPRWITPLRTPAQIAEDNDDVRILVEKIKTLPPACRRAFKLWLQEGSTASVAKQLGISRSCVHNHVRKGQRLAREFRAAMEADLNRSLRLDEAIKEARDIYQWEHDSRCLALMKEKLDAADRTVQRLVKERDTAQMALKLSREWVGTKELMQQEIRRILALLWTGGGTLPEGDYNNLKREMLAIHPRLRNAHLREYFRAMCRRFCRVPSVLKPWLDGIDVAEQASAIAITAHLRALNKET